MLSPAVHVFAHAIHYLTAELRISTSNGIYDLIRLLMAQSALLAVRMPQQLSAKNTDRIWIVGNGIVLVPGSFSDLALKVCRAVASLEMRQKLRLLIRLRTSQCLHDSQLSAVNRRAP